MNRVLITCFALILGLETALSAPLESTTQGKTEIEHVIASSEITVIQFWASWCVGCKDTMKVLSQNFLKSRNVKINVIFLSVDQEWEPIHEYFKYHSIEDPLIKQRTMMDKDMRIAKHWAVDRIPTVVLVNKKGIILKTMSGHFGEQELRVIQGFTAAHH